MPMAPFIWISEMMLFILQSSHLEDSESAVLLCRECEESDIFSGSNVRRYMFYTAFGISSESFLDESSS